MQAALNLLFPPQCLLCQARVPTEGTCCASCWSQLSFVTAPMCSACGFPFEYDLGEGALCAACIAAPPPYSKARTVLRFDDVSKELVHKLKFEDGTYLARTYGVWLAHAAADLLADCDCILPVPLHRRRLISRRYNQSALLANGLSRNCGLLVLADGLIRRRPTLPQSGLTRVQRQTNVRGAFAVNPAHKATLAGKTVLLIDDVMTTGFTLASCTKALLRAKVKSVYVLTLARVIHSQ